MRAFSKRFGIALLGAIVAAISVVSVAGATAYDLAPVTAPVQAQVTNALTVGLPIMGALVSLGIGIRLVKRFFHA